MFFWEGVQFTKRFHMPFSHVKCIRPRSRGGVVFVTLYGEECALSCQPSSLCNFSYLQPLACLRPSVRP